MKCMLIVLLLFLLAVPGANSAESRTLATLLVDGVERSYLVHDPAGKAGKEGLSVVIVLHGGGGNADEMARRTGWEGKADREGFLVVYPNGTGRFQDRFLTWNAGNCCGYAREHSANDVKFLRLLIGILKDKNKVNPDRIYITGFSNGAMMTYRAGCELSADIAAIAPVSGALNVACKPERPVSVIAFHGTADDHVPYDGGSGTRRVDPSPRVDTSVADSIKFWVKRDGCTPAPAEKTHGKIVTREYSGCLGRTNVKLYTIMEGGHAWPGGEKYAFWADEPTHEVSATDEIWAFFQSHPRSK